MSDRIEMEMDKRLGELARDILGATPKPSSDLMERILADAADVAAMTPAVAEKPRRRGFGWPIIRNVMPLRPSSAIAVLAVALMLGVGLGYGYGDRAMALGSLAKAEPEQEFDIAFVAMDGPF
ncbi:hypothetical protein KHP62_06420 [Rhodobacteraceae bacterium NNCM2]|nr:hypothetical protein [Coraliihabitans acroporae]